MERKTGTVVFWSKERGYGFIKPTDGDRNIFVHFSELTDCKYIKKNQEVSYVVGLNERGKIAKDVRVVSDAKTARNERADGTAAI